MSTTTTELCIECGRNPVWSTDHTRGGGCDECTDPYQRITRREWTLALLIEVIHDDPCTAGTF